MQKTTCHDFPPGLDGQTEHRVPLRGAFPPDVDQQRQRAEQDVRRHRGPPGWLKGNPCLELKDSNFCS